MIHLLFFIVFLFSVCLSAIVMRFTLHVSYQKKLFDIPDSRKVHTISTCRLGGFTFVPVIFAAFNLGIGLYHHFFLPIDMLAVEQFACLFIGLTLLYFIGLTDDLIEVCYKWKFLIQIAAACLFPLSGLYINTLGGLFGIYEISSWIGIPLTVFLVVYIVNAINLIDGIDGLASGLSCISLVVVGVLSYIYHEYFFVFLVIAAIGVLLPFLYHNIFGRADRHNKLFMGDAGSLTLGYILSFFLLQFAHTNSTNTLASHQLTGIQWVVFSSLFLPLFDVIRVVCSRFIDGRPLFMPDKNHIHHKFLRAGFSITGTLISLLLISLALISITYFLIPYIGILGSLLQDFAILAGTHFGLNFLIKRREARTGRIWHISYRKTVENQAV